VKIRTGDIYRLQMTKYRWANQFVNGKVLDFTCGKFLSYTTSKLLLENNVKEIWGYDILENQEYVTIRKIKENKIKYEIKSKSELIESKFDYIIAFNILSITENVSETIELIKTHLNTDGIALISIVNDDETLDSEHDLMTKELNLFSMKNFEYILKSHFKENIFFSQGIVTSIKSDKRDFRNLIRGMIKKFFLKSTNRYEFYLKNLKFLHKSASNINKNIKNKKMQKYKISEFNGKIEPMFIIAKCKK